MTKPARILCILLAMFAMIIATAALSAAEAPIPTQAACRIRVNDRDGATSCGSGTLVDVAAGGDVGLVLTNAHVVRDRATDECVVSFADGKRHGARIIKVDERIDAAVMIIARPGREAAPWTETLEGETFRGVGFGPSPADRLATMAGNVVADYGSESGRHSVSLNTPFRDGDSGGGLFDENGRLCGLIWGSTETEGFCVHPRQVAAFLVASGARPAPAVELKQFAECLPCQQQAGWAPVQGAPAVRYVRPAVRPLAVAVAPVAVAPVTVTPMRPCDCQSSIAALEGRLRELETRPPSPGERGPAGPPGPPGEAATFDADAVAAAVVAKLPPIRVIQRNAQTREIIGEKLVPLGGELTLNFGAGKQPIDARRSQP